MTFADYSAFNRFLRPIPDKLRFIPTLKLITLPFHILDILCTQAGKILELYLTSPSQTYEEKITTVFAIIFAHQHPSQKLSGIMF